MSYKSLCTTHRATLQRISNTKDALGASIKTWTDVGAGVVSCTLQPLAAKERLAFAQRNIFVSHRFYFTADPKAQPGDRVNLSDGRYFVVVGYFDQAGRNQVFSIDVLEQTGPRA